MEPKKVKKLALNKETISNLSNFEQSRIIGGNGEASNNPYNPICWFISAFGLPEYSCMEAVSECAYCIKFSYGNELSCEEGGRTCLQGGNCDSTDDPAFGCHTDRHC